MYVYPGAIRHVTPEHIRRYTPAIVGSSLMLLQNEISTEALCEVVKIAGEAGIEIIYNPAPARVIPRELFPYITILTPNETEAAILTGMDPEKPLDVDRALDMLHGFGAKNVIITMGGQGSVVSQAGKRFHVGALEGKVVSTTGAGDCYNAALAVKYLETCNILEAAEYASVAAGMQVMQPGVIANMPYRSEADEVFEKMHGAMVSAY